MNYQEFLESEFYGNAGITIVTAAVTFVAIFVVLAIFRTVLLQKMHVLSKKTKIQFDDAIVDVLRDIGTPFYTIVSVYVASKHLVLPSVVSTIIDAAFFIVIIHEVIKLIERIIHGIIVHRMQDKGGESKVPSLLSISIKVLLWAIGAVLILSNLGVNVNSLIAGLGIGGIAISLALQNILSDLFSSFSIAIDKPFEEGDFIVIGDHKGTVKHIGMKTTRIEALQGEELVISNNELTTARVQNFKKMDRRRIVFVIGVTYETPHEQLKKIPKMIEEIITKEEHAEFDRAHFYEFGDSNLNFEVVYYVLTGDYHEYMDAQQRMNLDIIEAFEKEGIEMAYPTRTVHMVQG